jgi:heme oxygenase|tara:strand:- start:596 stop:763 length:168 start_codon:yes stop_codon:yes gene_type:complete
MLGTRGRFLRVKPSNLATTQMKRLIAASLPAKLGRASEGQKLTLLSKTLTIAVAG